MESCLCMYPSLKLRSCLTRICSPSQAELAMASYLSRYWKSRIGNLLLRDLPASVRCLIYRQYASMLVSISLASSLIFDKAAVCTMPWSVKPSGTLKLTSPWEHPVGVIYRDGQVFYPLFMQLPTRPSSAIRQR